MIGMCGYWMDRDGSLIAMDADARKEAITATNAMARKGLRTIAIAQKKVKVAPGGAPVIGDGGKRGGSENEGDGDGDGAASAWRNALVLPQFEAGGHEAPGVEDGGERDGQGEGEGTLLHDMVDRKSVV